MMSAHVGKQTSVQVSGGGMSMAKESSLYGQTWLTVTQSTPMEPYNMRQIVTSGGLRRGRVMQEAESNTCAWVLVSEDKPGFCSTQKKSCLHKIKLSWYPQSGMPAGGGDGEPAWYTRTKYADVPSCNDCSHGTNVASDVSGGNAVGWECTYLSCCSKLVVQSMWFSQFLGPGSMCLEHHRWLLPVAAEPHQHTSALSLIPIKNIHHQTWCLSIPEFLLWRKKFINYSCKSSWVDYLVQLYIAARMNGWDDSK